MLTFWKHSIAIIYRARVRQTSYTGLRKRASDDELVNRLTTDKAKIEYLDRRASDFDYSATS